MNVCTFIAENYLFLEKYEHQNSQSPQGSVVIHHSASLNAYIRSRDVQYQSYVRWKFTGIPNPECGNGNKGQTRNPPPKNQISSL
eukprot:8541625-Ditylum_brightwellii.AAC.1